MEIKRVKYQASASFNIEDTIEVEEDCDDLEIWITIISDLERRHGLKVSYTKDHEGRE